MDLLSQVWSEALKSVEPLPEIDCPLALEASNRGGFNKGPCCFWTDKVQIAVEWAKELCHRYHLSAYRGKRVVTLIKNSNGGFSLVSEAGQLVHFGTWNEGVDALVEEV